MQPFRLHLGIPIALVTQACQRLDLMIEPVLCRVPTAYLWPSDQSKVYEPSRIRTALANTKADNIEWQNDGSIKVTWKRN